MLCRPILSTSSFDFLWKSLSFNSTMGLKLHIGIVITRWHSNYYYLKPYLILNKVVDDERLWKILHGHGELEKTEIRKFVTKS